MRICKISLQLLYVRVDFTYCRFFFFFFFFLCFQLCVQFIFVAFITAIAQDARECTVSRRKSNYDLKAFRIYEFYLNHNNSDVILLLSIICNANNYIEICCSCSAKRNQQTEKNKNNPIRCANN